MPLGFHGSYSHCLVLVILLVFYFSGLKCDFFKMLSFFLGSDKQLIFMDTVGKSLYYSDLFCLWRMYYVTLIAQVSLSKVIFYLSNLHLATRFGAVSLIVLKIRP